MKGQISNHLRERFYDVRDWVDIRPDPHWWPLAIVAGCAVFSLALVPPFLLGIMAVAALAFSLAGLILLAIALMTFVIVKGMAGYIADLRTHPVPTTERAAHPRIKAAQF